MTKSETAYAQFKNGLHQINSDKLNEALHAFSLAIQIDPYYFTSQIKIGDVLFTQNKHLEALGAYERAIHINPSESYTQQKRGLVLYDLNRKREALEAYDCSIDLDNTQPIVHQKKGVVLQDQWKQEEAIQSYDQLLLLDSNHIQGLMNKGICLYHLKKYNLAMCEFERLFSLEDQLIDNIASKLQYLKAKVIFSLNNQKTKYRALSSTFNDHLSECSAFSDTIQTVGGCELIHALENVNRSIEIDPVNQKTQDFKSLIIDYMNNDNQSEKEFNQTFKSKKHRLWKKLLRK